MRSSAIGPRCDVPEARPATSASPASVSAPSAASDFRPSRRASAAGVACIRSPPAEKNAIGVVDADAAAGAPVRRAAIPRRPASVASTRMAGVRSSSIDPRAGAHQRARRIARRSRAAVPAAAARRAAACRRCARSAARRCLWDRWCGRRARPAKRHRTTAAAVGFAHSTRVASALHSQAGSALVACAANFGSRRYESREPKSLIRVRPPGGAVISSNFVEIVIVPVGTKVHAARGIGAQRSWLTLIVARRSREVKMAEHDKRRISRFLLKCGHSPSRAWSRPKKRSTA